MSRSRGVPEVPMGIEQGLRRHLVDMREIVIQLRESLSPPTVPSNLKVTPQAFSNLVQWTRSLNADFFEVLWSSTPNLQQANIVNVGNSAQWVDQVGNSGITRYYWVRAAKNTGPRSLEIGAATGTTLASGAGVTPPPPPPASQQIVKQPQFNRPVPRGFNQP